MSERLKLMCVLAHPDDETFGCGGIIAKYAAEGVDVHLLTATRGERGWMGDPADDPGLEALGQTRESELRAAANILGVSDLRFLDYIDGEVDQADATEAIGRIVRHLRRVSPHVVITFDPFGAYGHPDHIAVTQFTQAAVIAAADASYLDVDRQAPPRVAKFYYQANAQSFVTALIPLMGTIEMDIDGVRREWNPWPDWAITTRLDATANWETVKRAAACHVSQLAMLPPLDSLSAEQHQLFWGHPTLYRVHSFVNGGRVIETDMFEGLRDEHA